MKVTFCIVFKDKVKIPGHILTQEIADVLLDNQIDRNPEQNVRWSTTTYSGGEQNGCKAWHRWQL